MRKFLTTACTLLALWPLWAQTAPGVKLADPQWHLWQSNLPPRQASLSLAASEQSLLRTLQPHLEAEDYQAAATMLREQPVAAASGALNLLRGQILLQLKDYASARASFEAVLAVAPGAARAHRGLAMVHLLEDRLAEAATHLAQALEQGDTGADTYAQLAYLNLRNGNEFAAVAGYQQALFLRPDNREWQQGLAYALTRSGQFAPAQALIEARLTEQPDDAELWLLRAQVALQQSRYTEALASLEVAERLGNREPQNRLLAAQLHLQHGSPARGVDLLVSQISGASQLQRDTLNTIAEAGSWLAANDEWSALEKLTRAVRANREIAPDAARALAVPSARGLLAKNRLSDARTLLSDTVKSDPGAGEALLLLGETLTRQGDASRALLYYQRAEALPPFRLRALLGQAQIEIDRQAHAAALTLLREALQTDPSRTDLRANIQALEQLLRHGDA